MSENQTPENQTQTQDQDAVKAAKMAVYAEKWAKIEAGKAAVADLEKDASDYATGVIKDYGTGPHGMHVNGKPHIVSFQRVNKAVRAHVLDLAKIKMPGQPTQ